MFRILLFFCFSFLLFSNSTSFAQTRWKFGLDLAAVGNVMNFQQIPSSPFLYNTLGNLNLPPMVSGATKMAFSMSLGVSLEYQLSRKVVIGATGNVFLRGLNRNNREAFVSYVGVTPIVKVFLLDRLPNWYVLGGLRADYMLDVDNLVAVPITDYFYKQWEISPMIGVGYRWLNLPFALQTDLRYNHGVKNLVAENPWKSSTNYNSSASYQSIWLHATLGLKKRQYR